MSFETKPYGCGRAWLCPDERRPDSLIAFEGVDLAFSDHYSHAKHKLLDIADVAPKGMLNAHANSIFSRFWDPRIGDFRNGSCNMLAS